MDENERRALARAAAAARPIGAFSAQALYPAARARGFATAALLADWPTIVGAELARFTMPDRMVWPRHRNDDGETVRHQGRREEGAVLILRVDGPRAIEVQHRSRQILERVNGHFGYRAVAEMRILQAPVARKPAPSPSAPEALEPGTLPPSASIEDGDLRDALKRLASVSRRGC
ncbi:MAG TPA: DciA family protein [Methyloceanibacter sp.]|nr:DciA family protein [Methyloceanibacter sp.]